MAISLDAVVNLAMALAGASRAAYTVIDDPKRFWGSFEAAALNADRQIIATILENPNHLSYKALLSFIPITNGATIPNRFHAVKIDGDVGDRVDFSRLKLNKATTLAGVNTAATKQYAIMENCIFFIGTLCEIQVPTYTPSASLSAPDQYIMAVVAGALAQAAVVGDEGIACAGHFAGMFTQMLGAIASGSRLPELKPYSPVEG